MFKLASETKTDPVLPAGAASPWRDRSVEENLELFDQMRCGLWDEGTATLRMKMDLMSPNPNMWDHAAYRIMFSAHPHSGDKWCIYPTYAPTSTFPFPSHLFILSRQAVVPLCLSLCVCVCVCVCV